MVELTEIETILTIVLTLILIVTGVLAIFLFRLKRTVTSYQSGQAVVGKIIQKNRNENVDTVTETIFDVIKKVNALTKDHLGFEPLNSEKIEIVRNDGHGTYSERDTEDRLIVLYDPEKTPREQGVAEALFFVIQYQFLNELKKHMNKDILDAFNLAITKYFLESLKPIFSYEFKNNMENSQALKQKRGSLNESDKKMWEYYNLFEELLLKLEFNQIIITTLREFNSKAPEPNDETRKELGELIDLFKHLGKEYRGTQESVGPVIGKYISVAIAKIGGPFGERYTRYISDPRSSPPCERFLNKIVSEKKVKTIFITAEGPQAVKLAEVILELYRDDGMEAEKITLPSEDNQDILIGILTRTKDLIALKE